MASKYLLHKVTTTAPVVASLPTLYREMIEFLADRGEITILTTEEEDKTPNDEILEQLVNESSEVVSESTGPEDSEDECVPCDCPPDFVTDDVAQPLTEAYEAITGRSLPSGCRIAIQCPEKVPNADDEFTELTPDSGKEDDEDVNGEPCEEEDRVP